MYAVRKDGAISSWLAAVTVPGNLNSSARRTKIMQASWKVSLKREIEARHKEEVREILTGNIQALPWTQKITW